MHDLRYDPDDPKLKPAAAFAAMREQFGAAFDAMDPAAHAADPRVMRAADLRTVPMPELRSADARTLDAAQRGTRAHDCRTFDEQVIAELVRIVDALQALSLRLEEVEGVVTHIARSPNVPEVQTMNATYTNAVTSASVAPEPDWSKAPKWCCWWAVNEDGTATWFGPRPSLGSRWWYVRQNSTHCNVTSHAARHVDLNGCDWQETLRYKPGFVP